MVCSVILIKLNDTDKFARLETRPPTANFIRPGTKIHNNKKYGHKIMYYCFAFDYQKYIIM